VTELLDKFKPKVSWSWILNIFRWNEQNANQVELDLYIHRDIMAAENMADILAYELIFGADERPQYLTKQKMQLVKLRKSDSSNERKVSFLCGAFFFSVKSKPQFLKKNGI
jgi:hypothetical protein